MPCLMFVLVLIHYILHLDYVVYGYEGAQRIGSH